MPKKKTIRRAPRIERIATMSCARRSQIMLRSAARYDEVQPVVTRVIDDIRKNGDRALLKYTKRFDRASLTASDLVVSKKDIRAAYRAVKKKDPDLIPAIESSLDCIRGYHEGEVAQLKRGLGPWRSKVSSSNWKSRSSLDVGQLRTPLDSAGVYVPGGNAVLLTSALMAVTPAKVAGVPQVVLCSPPSRGGDIDPRLVVAADRAGADMIVRAGGAQAVAAMAYGTESVPRVCKIVGPGNVYVAAAKALVAATGACAVDLPAGPSEILIIADSSAEAAFVARDMLSQSEHDADASAILVTTSKKLAGEVRKALSAELRKLPVDALAGKSLTEYGAIVVADSVTQAVAFSNEFAPEHLEIMTRNPRKTLESIRNAGGIFLGNYSPVAIGDYICPNHILPTGGAARFTAGVSVDTFLKKPSVLQVPKSLIPTLNRLVETLSKAEGLYEQHGRSVACRNRR